MTHKKEKVYGSKSIYLTFDVEPDIQKMGGGCDGMEIAVPAIMELFQSMSIDNDNIRATWFITHDNWAHIDDLYQTICDDLVELDQEIGLHVHFSNGTGPCFEKAVQEQLISKGSESLRNKGYEINSFRGGGFYFDNQTIKILEHNNIFYDSSVIPGSKYVSHTIPGFFFDHSRCLINKPYHPSYRDHCSKGNAKLLEVPLFINTYFKKRFRGLNFQLDLLIGKKNNSLVNCIHNVLKTGKLPRWLTSKRNNIVVLMAHPWEFIDKTPATSGKLKTNYIEGFKHLLDLLNKENFIFSCISDLNSHKPKYNNKVDGKVDPIFSFVKQRHFTISLNISKY